MPGDAADVWSALAGCSRDKLVCVALTGGDYMKGVKTMGVVTVLELLAEFSGEGIGPFQDFGLWSSRLGRSLACLCWEQD